MIKSGKNLVIINCPYQIRCIGLLIQLIMHENGN
ncbi:MAG: hypothetical protein JEY79_00455 [Pseudodesulfovibrio sp.]|nr:hypothetical protein [Pseudodesulfovibrio sp.]